MTTLYINNRSIETRAVAFDGDERDFIVIQRDDESIEDFKKRAAFTLQPKRVEAMKIAYMNPYK